jgi:hypothetical protein
MKKGISISLSLLMLIAILHISVATHYCGGKEVASKISFAGKLADCGMEGSEKQLPPQGSNISRHCCDNIITFCGINNNYFPTSSFVPELYQYNILIWSIPAEFPTKSRADDKQLYSNVSPPGASMSTSVNLSNICVFRI